MVSPTIKPIHDDDAFAPAIVWLVLTLAHAFHMLRPAWRMRLPDMHREGLFAAGVARAGRRAVSSRGQVGTMRAAGMLGAVSLLACAAMAVLPAYGAQAPLVPESVTGETLRPAQAVDFELPARMFNGHTAALDVTVKGSGRLEGNRLTLSIDALRIGELLTRRDTERLHADRLEIVPVDHDGKHAFKAGSTHSVPLGAPGPDRAYVVRDVHAELTLDAEARLDRMWLQLELHHGNGYTPIDATRGHLARSVGAVDPAFDPCARTAPDPMDAPTAIEQHCNARLAAALDVPFWHVVARYRMWRDKDRLALQAYYAGNADAIHLLHDAGVPMDTTDEKGRTALMLAAWNNRRDLVEALLAAGADPYFRPHPRSHSALSGALDDGYDDIVRLMLKDTTVLDRQAPGFGFHPAHLVVVHGHLETLRLLLQRGLSVDAVNTGFDARGETLLMEAARSRTNGIAIANLLLERGARLDATDRHGKNATDWAEFFGNRALSDLLCARGLEPTPLSGDEKHKRASCATPSQATGFDPDRDL